MYRPRLEFAPQYLLGSHADGSSEGMLHDRPGIYPFLVERSLAEGDRANSQVETRPNQVPAGIRADFEKRLLAAIGSYEK